jgi:hypothetical protein
MQTVERFLALLFGAIVLALVITNPRGVEAILKGFATFTGETVGAFGRFAGRA